MYMNEKYKIKFITEFLNNLYPQAVCELDYSHPHELLIAARLSAQCTDARVNVVTKDLFKKYPDIESFACADVEDIENIIKSCGLFHTKANDIVNMCKMLLTEFDGKIPSTIEKLTTLPGVGRKTANLIRGDVFGLPAVVTDTHCIRISNRLGLANSTNPLKVEKQLRKLLDRTLSNDFCHRLVLFGREICKARNPKCEKCLLNKICSYFLSCIK